MLSAVCRRWHTAASKVASLWKSAPMLQPPSNIVWNSYDPKIAEVKLRLQPLSSALARLDRVKHLDLKLETNELDHLYGNGKILCRAAPSLERLAIRHFHYWDDRHDDYNAANWTPTYDYPPNEAPFLFPNSPFLREVILENVDLEWPRFARAWPSLTSLTIEMLEYPPRDSLSFSDIRETLSLLPSLEALNLVGTAERLNSEDVKELGRLGFEFSDHGLESKTKWWSNMLVISKVGARINTNTVDADEKDSFKDRR